MIDGVEQGLLQHVGKVGHLEHEHAAFVKKRPHPRHHARQIVNMGEHVVGRDHGGGATFLADLRGQSGVEKGVEGLDSRFTCGLRDITRRINTLDGHPRLLEEAQQGAIVGTYIHHQGAGR